MIIDDLKSKMESTFIFVVEMHIYFALFNNTINLNQNPY